VDTVHGEFVFHLKYCQYYRTEITATLEYTPVLIKRSTVKIDSVYSALVFSWAFDFNFSGIMENKAVRKGGAQENILTQ
jgi:hypothetical protein